MNAIALLVRHKTRPGAREKMMDVWTRHVRPQAEANPGHLAYYFCFDDSDPDKVFAFQIFSSEEARSAFRTGAWYQNYLKEVSAHVEGPPDIVPAHVVWSKKG